MIEHAPPLTSVTVVLETVQTGIVVDVYDTAKPDEAVAVSVTLPEPKTTLLNGPKVIVCDAGVMVKL